MNSCEEGYICELLEGHKEEYHQAKIGKGMLTWKDAPFIQCMEPFYFTRLDRSGGAVYCTSQKGHANAHDWPKINWDKEVELICELTETREINLAYERFFKRTFTFEEAELYNKQWLRETLPYGTAK